MAYSEQFLQLAVWVAFVLGLCTGGLVAALVASRQDERPATKMTGDQFRERLGTLGWTNASQLNTLVLLVCAELDRAQSCTQSGIERKKRLDGKQGQV